MSLFRIDDKADIISDMKLKLVPNVGSVSTTTGRISTAGIQPYQVLVILMYGVTENKSDACTVIYKDGMNEADFIFFNKINANNAALCTKYSVLNDDKHVSCSKCRLETAAP